MGHSDPIQRLEAEVARLEAKLDALAGCDGNCSCAVWRSRHEAAMALYRQMEKNRDGQAALASIDTIVTGCYPSTADAVKQVEQVLAALKETK